MRAALGANPGGSRRGLLFPRAPQSVPSSPQHGLPDGGQQGFHSGQAEGKPKAALCGCGPGNRQVGGARIPGSAVDDALGDAAAGGSRAAGSAGHRRPSPGSQLGPAYARRGRSHGRPAGIRDEYPGRGQAGGSGPVRETRGWAPDNAVGAVSESRESGPGGEQGKRFSRCGQGRVPRAAGGPPRGGRVVRSARAQRPASRAAPGSAVRSREGCRRRAGRLPPDVWRDGIHRIAGRPGASGMGRACLT